MAVIKSQKIPETKNDFSAEELLARFCYYYQQYTYEDAKKLSYKRIKQMLTVAIQEESKFKSELIEIVLAPIKKDHGKSLTDYYAKIIKG